MKESKESLIIKQLKEIAKGYNINIALPKQVVAIEEDIFLNHSKKYDTNTIMIVRNKNVSTGQSSIVINKNRHTCYIQDCIERNDLEGLQYYMDKLDEEILTKVNTALFMQKYHYNIVDIIKNNKLDFLQVLEKSTAFQKTIENKKDFWLNVSLEADNYEFFVKKTSIEHLLECEKLQEKIINYLPQNILYKIIENEHVKNKLEKEFELIFYIPNYMNNELEQKAHNILELLLKNTKPNYDNLHMNELFDNFDLANMLQTKEKNKQVVNNALKVFIIHSDYEFTEKDKSLSNITKENKVLINKKELNKHLSMTLLSKPVLKKIKI